MDLRFAPLHSAGAHVTVPVAELKAGLFRDGYYRDAVGPTGPRLLVPAPETAFLDPFFQHSTLTLLCEVRDAAVGADEPHDARGAATGRPRRARLDCPGARHPGFPRAKGPP